MLLFSSWQAERTFAVTNMNVRHADKAAANKQNKNVGFVSVRERSNQFMGHQLDCNAPHIFNGLNTLPQP